MPNIAKGHFPLGKRLLAEFAGQNSAGNFAAPSKKKINKNECDSDCLAPMDCPPSPLHAQTHLAPAHTNHSHSSSKSSSVTNSHPVIVQSPKSVPLNHSAPVFRPSVHSVTKPIYIHQQLMSPLLRSH